MVLDKVCIMCEGNKNYKVYVMFVRNVVKKICEKLWDEFE